MIIGIDVRSLMEGRHSGVEEYSCKIIRAMVRRSPQDKFILFYNSFRSIQLPDFGASVQIVDFGYPNKLLNMWQFLLRRPRWDELIENKIGVKLDVVFSPNVRLLPLTDTALVVTAHDLSYELFPEFYSWRRRLWHKLMRPRRLLRTATEVVAVSQATKDDVVRLYGVSPARVAVIYSGVGFDGEDIGESHKKRKLLESNGSGLLREKEKSEKKEYKYILYLGTLEPRKNIISIVEAFTEVADRIPHHLVIAGETGWLSKNIKRAVAKSRAKHKIHRIGFVREEDKRQLYEEADLFIYPSFYEGFGFPPLEALLAGTPVITSHNSSLPEVAGEFTTLVNPYDVAELALVIEELINNPQVVESDIRQEIKRRFSWELAAKETLAILRQAARTKQVD